MEFAGDLEEVELVIAMLYLYVAEKNRVKLFLCIHSVLGKM